MPTRPFLHMVQPRRSLSMGPNPLQLVEISPFFLGVGENIWLARQDPGGGKTANWLPAPASGPYRLIMRTYLPKQKLLAGTYLLPPLMPA